MASALQIMRPATGELLDLVALRDEVHDEHSAKIAALVDDLEAVRGLLADAENVCLDELLDRLDKRGEWTLRVGEPEDGVQYEIKAPSPTAGTTGLDVATLRAGVLALLEEKLIEQELADEVVVCSVTFKAQVPVGTDLEKLRERLLGIQTMASVPLRDVEVVTSEKATIGGAGKLKKIGRKPAEVYEASLTTIDAPPRRVKVTAKTKGRRS